MIWELKHFGMKLALGSLGIAGKILGVWDSGNGWEWLGMT